MPIENFKKTSDDRNLIVNIYNSFDVCASGTKITQKQALHTVQLRARSSEGTLVRCIRVCEKSACYQRAIK